MATHSQDCIFCKIIAGELESTKVWENSSFIAIQNKYPEAPIHVLVMPKLHIEKDDVMTVKTQPFWGDIMSAVTEVIQLRKLDTQGYKLVINGAGYNHLEHEHVHIMSGLAENER
ncbi:MAG: HIT domain-containing protein [Candidatus Dojkabacteria bacterium]|nr:MAG: HIT domain-containing protein [Candidatus Dojkabacteria bacterium]